MTAPLTVYFRPALVKTEVVTVVTRLSMSPKPSDSELLLLDTTPGAAGRGAPVLLILPGTATTVPLAVFFLAVPPGWLVAGAGYEHSTSHHASTRGC
jgi:hypothetical protein